MKRLTIGIVAGEVSGDLLGADLMAKLNALYPTIYWVGVGGTHMKAQGLNSLLDMSRLSVMGLSEVVRHLPDLLNAKKEILSAFNNARIDLFIGIDAPDFNLRLGKALKPKGVCCVQYVSPSIWAWRERRIHNIIQSTNLVLCLFPFETDVYKRYGHPAICVGHPLIKTLIPSDYSKEYTLCLMGGSRVSEINAILPTLLQSFAQLFKQNPCITAVLPLANESHKALVQSLIDKTIPHLAPFLTIFTASDWQACQKFTNRYTASQYAMQISQFVLLASGTATLEALLLHVPMVVLYKVNPATYHIAKHLIKIPYVALPNILHHHLKGNALVPECLQKQANPPNIASIAQQCMDDTDYIARLTQFANTLRQTQNTDPATVILEYYQENYEQ